MKVLVAVADAERDRPLLDMAAALARDGEVIVRDHGPEGQPVHGRVLLGGTTPGRPRLLFAARQCFLGFVLLLGGIHPTGQRQKRVSPVAAVSGVCTASTASAGPDKANRSVPSLLSSRRASMRRIRTAPSTG